MRADENWWQTFFTGLVVDFWRAVMPPEATRAEAEFFERILEVPPGGSLLDVPCGDGRLALDLAGRGYRVTGVDISPGFLDAARESAGARGLEIRWRMSDMRNLPWEEAFDGALCAGSSFGFLGDEGDFDFLRAVAGTLKPRARFVLDGLKAMEVVLPQFRERHDIAAGDIRFLAENRYDHEAGWTENRYTISRGNRTETRLARHRIYLYRELVEMLRRAGFEGVRGYGSLDGKPFELGSPKLILAASKAA